MIRDNSIYREVRTDTNLIWDLSLSKFLQLLQDALLCHDWYCHFGPHIITFFIRVHPYVFIVVFSKQISEFRRRRLPDWNRLNFSSRRITSSP